MITSIYVDGFKTLSDFRLELSPGLNILVGPNGSGKTNIISFFEFLSHVVEKDPAEATSHLGGAGAVFRRVQDAYQHDITAKITGCFPLSQGRFPSEPKDKNRYALYEYEFSISYANKLEAVVFKTQHFRYRRATKFVRADSINSLQGDWELDAETRLEDNLSVTTRVYKLGSELAIYFPIGRGSKSDQVTKEAQEFLSRTNSVSTSIPALFMRFSPLFWSLSDDLAGGQTYNIIPSRVKLLEDSARPPGIDRDGSGLSSTLYSLRERNLADNESPWAFIWPSGRRTLKRPSMETLKKYFQLANSSIDDIEVLNDPFNNQLRVTCMMRNGEYKASVPLSLLSDGTLKWLTLITAALTASSVFSIEEPENYLHPSVQGEFVNIMRAILFEERKYACTLMTTHSETLLNQCKPAELVVLSLQNGRTVSFRANNQRQVSQEIQKTGFGLGYYYIAGALQNE